MSYLSSLVNSAKSTSGYSGRSAGKYRRLENSLKKNENDNEEGEKVDGKNKLLVYGVGGLVVLGGGYFLYKKYKASKENNRSGSSVSPPTTVSPSAVST